MRKKAENVPLLMIKFIWEINITPGVGGKNMHSKINMLIEPQCYYVSYKVVNNIFMLQIQVVWLNYSLNIKIILVCGLIALLVPTKI